MSRTGSGRKGPEGSANHEIPWFAMTRAVELTTLALLLAQIAAILLVSRALGLVTRWLGQPLVIAEMLAGIALGPSLLGLFFPHAFETLFPAASLGVLKTLSQLGLVLF